jgi:glycosyltransferase involved in cell wall biosynthesis
MNILWVCNIPLTEASALLNEKPKPTGGWLLDFAEQLSNQENILFSVAFKTDNANKFKVLKGKKTYHYPFYSNSDIEKIVNIVKPDILHVWGTEFQHSLAAIKAYNKPQRTVINIQGLVSVYSQHYYANMPSYVINRFTIRDFLKRDNIRQHKNDLIRRGSYEIEAIKSVKHIIGRTDWDKACTSQINPSVNYHFCNETLRDEFYIHEWDIHKCKRHTIFISQIKSPIKGFHYLLDVMPIILNKFSDTEVYVAGNDINKIPFYKITSYQKYLKELIRKHKLGNKVHFLGMLSEIEMCQQYLSSHVFVSLSTIENESNSVSEAKILGVPVVASYVGGVTSRIQHDYNGFLYQHDIPQMLAHYICKIFKDDDLALKISSNAKEDAKKINDKTKNFNQLLKIYNNIIESN